MIVGYGRAGKRHSQLLSRLGIKWYAVDPFVDVPESAPIGTNFDFAVIATPPQLHLDQVKRHLDSDIPVLCEKPLCGLGQLDQARGLLDHPNADKVMIAYNYRFHPKLQGVERIPTYFTCWQNRQLPEWGLLLDHCSHDLDILRQLCGEIEIKKATYHPKGSLAHDKQREMWMIIAQAGNEEIILREMVGPTDKRQAMLEFWQGDAIELDADPMMFEQMYNLFLDGCYWPNLAEAIKTQELLERCEELNNVSTHVDD